LWVGGGEMGSHGRDRIRGVDLLRRARGQARDLEPALREALAYRGPALVDVAVDPNEPPMPGKVSYEQAKRFAQAFLRGEPYRATIATTLLKDRIQELRAYRALARRAGERRARQRMFLPLRVQPLQRRAPLDMRLDAVRVGGVTAGYARFGRAVRILTADARHCHVNIPLSGGTESRAGRRHEPVRSSPRRRPTASILAEVVAGGGAVAGRFCRRAGV